MLRWFNVMAQMLSKCNKKLIKRVRRYSHLMNSNLDMYKCIVYTYVYVDIIFFSIGYIHIYTVQWRLLHWNCYQGKISSDSKYLYCEFNRKWKEQMPWKVIINRNKVKTSNKRRSLTANKIQEKKRKPERNKDGISFYL